MKPSQGSYFVGLDHIRALAAFTVFVWHFNHVSDGHLATSEYPFLAILMEGHVGVAIFMTLSGYLFAKILFDARFFYPAFLYNRFLRLLPLLILVTAIVMLRKDRPDAVIAFLKTFVRGFVFPEWPNGGWSVAVELHFYFLLPVLLWITRKSKYICLCLIACCLLGRWAVWSTEGTVQTLSYWTIVGRIDQFILGLLAFVTADLVKNKHVRALLIFFTLLTYIAFFDHLGGFYSNTRYPSPHPVWIIDPTILGLGFAYLVAWYDTSFTMPNKGISGLIARIGACSYSIYLLHSFVVFWAAQWIHDNIVDLTSSVSMLLSATVCFLLFVPFAYLSYIIIELPPLRFRLNDRRTKRCLL